MDKIFSTKLRKDNDRKLMPRPSKVHWDFSSPLSLFHGIEMPVDAEVAHKEFQRLMEDELPLGKVVDVAVGEDSPLHDAFDWDDKRAARMFRLLQAADLMAGVVDEQGESLYMRVDEDEEETA
jgi:hypothetical protein